MSQENIEVVRHMLDAFNRGDVPAVLAAFDRNCELDEPPEMPDRRPGGFRGHDGIREWMANLREVAGIARAQGFLSKDEALEATGLSRFFTSAHPGASA
jgi:ketosteroid isomerase-like protein